MSHHTGSEAVIRLRDRCLSSCWAWTSAIARTTLPFAWRSVWTPPAESPIYHLRHLERFRLGTSYPAVVERVGEMLAGPPLWGCRQLVAWPVMAVAAHHFFFGQHKKYLRLPILEIRPPIERRYLG